ncbi:MAG: ECF transporter S component [Clostridia bacterium]|nr:ECF transporter S component [Clostridia bacterium]MBQ7907332.1 ECF transporter S component [Clostridia bacterium]
MKSKKARSITTIGVFCALAYVLSVLTSLVVPIKFNEFLGFDFKDSVIVMAGFALGPYATIIISLVVSFVEMVTISTTGPIGMVMNIISSVTYAIIPSLLYKKNRRFYMAIIGLVLGTLVTTGTMILWNFLITPHYNGTPQEVVNGMLLPVFLPFNLIKYSINTVIAIVIYKPVVRVLRKVLLLDQKPKKQDPVSEIEEKKAD